MGALCLRQGVRNDLGAVVGGFGWRLVLLSVVLLYVLAPILMPFLAGALLASWAARCLDRLESWKLSRTASVTVVS